MHKRLQYRWNQTMVNPQLLRVKTTSSRHHSEIWMQSRLEGLESKPYSHFSSSSPSCVCICLCVSSFSPSPLPRLRLVVGYEAKEATEGIESEKLRSDDGKCGIANSFSSFFVDNRTSFLLLNLSLVREILDLLSRLNCCVVRLVLCESVRDSQSVEAFMELRAVMFYWALRGVGSWIFLEYCVSLGRRLVHVLLVFHIVLFCTPACRRQGLLRHLLQQCSEYSWGFDIRHFGNHKGIELPSG